MFKQSLYYQSLRSVLLGVGSAGITIALSYLPYADLLQAAWIFISTTYIAALAFRRRVREDDEQRFERLYKERIKLWARRDPQVLTALFSQNLAEKQIAWLAEELDTPLAELDEIHALDSLARAGDQPGQLSLRAGLLLGRWSAELELNQPEHQITTEEATTLTDAYREKLLEWVQANHNLLGEELSEGIFLREIQRGEQRPIGVHLASRESKLLFTHERLQQDESTYSVALSLDATLTSDLSEEAWEAWRDELFLTFPFFKRVNQGSGPQKRVVPYFIQPRLPEELLALSELTPKLEKLLAKLESLQSTSAQELPPAPDGAPEAEQSDA